MKPGSGGRHEDVRSEPFLALYWNWFSGTPPEDETCDTEEDWEWSAVLNSNSEAVFTPERGFAIPETNPDDPSLPGRLEPKQERGSNFFMNTAKAQRRQGAEGTECRPDLPACWGSDPKEKSRGVGWVPPSPEPTLN